MTHRTLALLALLACSPRDTAPASTSTTPPAPAPVAAPPQDPAPPAPAPRLSTRPPHPDEPNSPQRQCARDDDCALLPDDCHACPPCTATWRRAGNQSALQAAHAERARVPCPPISCEPCPMLPIPPGQARPETGWIGDRAVCRAGQCAVE